MGLNKYQREIKGVVIDFYDIAEAYGITSHAIAHALKKLLRYGGGDKSLAKDVAEAKWSLTRWEEQQKENESSPIQEQRKIAVVFEQHTFVPHPTKPMICSICGEEEQHLGNHRRR